MIPSSDTPLTDAQAGNGFPRSAQIVPADFCRSLERTTLEQAKRIEELEAALRPWIDAYHSWMAEGREVGHSEFNVTAGMVCRTYDALSPETKQKLGTGSSDPECA